jgi:hypothetical protein
MATDQEPSHTLDVQGLLAFSKASGNEFASVKADLESGRLAVYNSAWKEFCEAYPDESSVLASISFEKKKVLPEHRLASAAIAERGQSTFGWSGPYDRAIEWRVAGVASYEKLVVVTDARRKKTYEDMDGITAMTFDEYVSDH